MSLWLATPASGLPITLAEAKLHLHVEIDDDDALITSLIAAATEFAEGIMNRAVMPQKWQLSLPAFDSVIALQKPPVSGVDSIKYVDASGNLATLSPSVYQVVKASEYTASVVPAYGQVWPASRAQPEAVQIIFSCGYADAASVPELIKEWIKLCIGALYENPASVSDRPTFSLGIADRMLNRYRVWLL